MARGPSAYSIRHLCPDAAARGAEVEGIALGTPVLLLSALEKTGLDAARAYLAAGTTAAFVGSSGVGKSTIINRLADTALRVKPVRAYDDRGQHTTTSRQMIFLSGEGILIDTPGMREVQLLEHQEGAAQAFEDIGILSQGCKFRDCGHRGEPGAPSRRLSGRASYRSNAWRAIASCWPSFSFRSAR